MAYSLLIFLSLIKSFLLPTNKIYVSGYAFSLISFNLFPIFSNDSQFDTSNTNNIPSAI